MTSSTSSTVTDIVTQAHAALDRFDAPGALVLLEPLRDTEESAAYLACLIEAQGAALDFKPAEATVERAIALHPLDAGIQQAAGTTALRARNYPLAEQRFEKAAQLKPGYAPAYNNLGVVYEYLKRNDAAQTAYQRAVELDPALATSYQNLGRMAERAGQLDQARAYYEQGRTRSADGAGFERLLHDLGRNYADPADAGFVTPGSPEAFLSVEIGNAAKRHLPADLKPAVLDLICGAGSVGKLLWDGAGRMVGVDPRIALLQQAQAQNIYYDLKDQTPSIYLRSCKRGETDLITSNCGFSNLGDLLAVFIDIYAVLAPGGLLVMAYATRSDSLGYYIEGNGSFSHDPNYIVTRADFEGMALKERLDYEPATHPQLDRAYTLMVFAKPR